jgi:glycosyltransferase involved in cell wall biosynthesis
MQIFHVSPLTLSTKPLSIITVTRLRAKVLAERALHSLRTQECKDFQWILINDGCDPATRDCVAELRDEFSFEYIEMNHPETGFGLCHGRNLGLEVAHGELVTYLDDDNRAAPGFVKSVLDFFARHSGVRCAMVQQLRWREGGRHVGLDEPVRKFISPAADASARILIRQEELFDSNGFVHVRADSPQWNPTYCVYADYEYFLRCLGVWGRESFAVLPQVLIEYVQSREGVIGRSHFGQWAEELRQLLTQSHDYPVLHACDHSRLEQLAQKYADQYRRGKAIPAFA